jgi:hypothetical protein
MTFAEHAVQHKKRTARDTDVQSRLARIIITALEAKEWFDDQARKRRRARHLRTGNEEALQHDATS